MKSELEYYPITGIEKGPNLIETALFVFFKILYGLFFLELFVFVLEFVNSTGSIDQLRLPGVIWVRSPRDLQLHEGIRYPVYINGFFGFRR